MNRFRYLILTYFDFFVDLLTILITTMRIARALRIA